MLFDTVPYYTTLHCNTTLHYTILYYLPGAHVSLPRMPQTAPILGRQAGPGSRGTARYGYENDDNDNNDDNDDNDTTTTTTTTTTTNTNININIKIDMNIN